MEKSRILVIGATGKLGYHLAEASLKYFHPTFALVRESSFSDPIKAQKLHEPTIAFALSLVDVVICALSSKHTLHQNLLIRLIKQSPSIKRFIPSEFGSDPTRVRVSELEDGYNFYAPKLEIRRLVEAQGIPYTIISCNFFMRVLLPSLAQPGLDAPPRDKVTIFGDGNTKGVFMNESDVAAFTINA